ncbi:PDZ and LIM domain protein 5-like isoform X2 [Megalops cyprinoides]|uniref:PDZ and LIM domain protein 5-like isoform X2 n=1 Tax=Megalops cyprinoides TaxID=118141 RepID=UPI001863D1E8|nr:PDZ and LIM domain protein 5-like isoform X2 [Megalops cyprinoides]
MSSNYSVSLAGPAPWGFRLQGGKDFNMPLTISRLTDGGKAAKANISVGDVVLSIDGIATEGMNHLEAQNKIKACAGNLNLTLQKASSVPKPVVPKETPPVTNGPHTIQKKTLPPRAPRKPIVETDIEFYHVPSHGDASKKRLIEDTEDWHPRTGTSQSRSFRILAQITGTEHELERKDSDTEKKTNDFADEAKPTSHITSPVKTMTKSPASAPRNVNPSPGTAYKSPSAQGSGYFKSGPQVGHVAPSYGMVSNSNPRALPPERPIPQPHPKDEDSLVQRAEHMPAGTRTPMCAHCNMAIRGPFLVAMGKSWHPEEFNCAHCRTSLADIGFVEERGSVYCEHCYEEFFAPTCGRCQQKILGEVINALKQTWHVYCFLCSSCQQPIRSNTFHLEDGVPYCEADYYNLFGTSCHGCDFPIEAGDKFLEALGFTWHDTCFVCSVCCTSLEGQSFFSKKDKPLCKKHAHTVKI